MEDEIVRKLQSLEDATGLDIDAFGKSLRCYSTEVHPILKERLLMLGCIEDDISEVTSTTSYNYIQTDQGFTGASFSNYIFQSLFDREEPEYHSVIYAKCSSKTRGPHGFGSATMDKLVGRKLREGAMESNRPLRLWDLSVSELGYDVTQDLLKADYLETTLARGIDQFLGQNQFTFPASTFVDIPGRNLPQDLIMDSKFYATRNDNRAFCKDRHLLRHLCGCCLHRLFLPKEPNLRTGLHRNNVVPAYGKDELSYIVPRLRGKSGSVVFSDISNFTGSAGNAWLMLHVAAAQLSRSGAWDKPPNIFCIKGSFLEATWRELIILYLYLTVGVPCIVQPTGELGYLPGGFLGVAANCTLGLVMMAFILENLKRILRRKLDYVQAQAGGDDTCFLLVGDRNDVRDAILTIQDHLTRYVGHVKEFVVIDLEEAPEGVHPTARFCKKQVHIRKFVEHYEITTLPSIPIPESLSSNGRIKEGPKTQQCWNALHLDLKRWVLRRPDEVQIYADTVRARFLELYPVCWPPTETTSVKRWEPRLCWSDIGGVKITDRALKIVHAISDLSGHMGDYLNTFRERVHYSLVLGKTLRRSALLGGEEVTVIIAKGQVHAIKTERTTVPVGIICDETLLGRIRLTFT